MQCPITVFRRSRPLFTPTKIVLTILLEHSTDGSLQRPISHIQRKKSFLCHLIDRLFSWSMIRCNGIKRIYRPPRHADDDTNAVADNDVGAMQWRQHCCRWCSRWQHHHRHRQCCRRCKRSLPLLRAYYRELPVQRFPCRWHLLRPLTVTTTDNGHLGMFSVDNRLIFTTVVIITSLPPGKSKCNWPFSGLFQTLADYFGALWSMFA